MPNQTPQAGSSVPSANGTQLNPLAVNLAKAIRLQEGGGQVNYNAVGDNGSSRGAYQFHNDNFQKWATQYGLNPNDFSPVNQDKVAYSRINDLLTQGRAPSEVAAAWNGAKEVNGKLEPINPSYVEGVKRYYSQVVGGGSPVASNQVARIGQANPQQDASANLGSDTFTPSSPLQAAPEQPAPQPQQDNSLTGIPVVDSVANFLFPIAGDVKNDIQGTSQKSALQQTADLGLSVLPFTGVGDVGEALRGAGLLGENAGALTRLLTGAATGYGYGSLANVAQGQSLGQAISPNAGNLGGAALGGAASAILPKIFAPFSKNLTKSGAQAALEDSFTSEANRLKPTVKALADMPDKGRGAIETITRTPEALPKVIDGHHFDTTEGSALMGKKAGLLSQLRAVALTKMGVSFSLSDLQDKADTMLRTEKANSPTLMAQQEDLAKTIAALKKNYGGETITPLQLEAIKEEFPYASQVARSAKKMLEETTAKSGAPDLQVFNREIQKHLQAQTILDNMQGQVVKGGRLGNMLRGHTAAIVGSIVGGGLGGGWTGEIGGALAGEAMSRILGRWQANTAFTTPLQQAILDRLATEDPGIVQQYARYASAPGTTPVQTSPQRPAPVPSAASGLFQKLLVSSAARTPAMIAH